MYYLSCSFTCTAACNEAGMYMPGGSCTSPVSVNYVSNYYYRSCTPYCASAASDCSVCGRGTYYEGYSDNTACDACESGKTITDDGTAASKHDEADDCVVYSTRGELRLLSCRPLVGVRYL